MDIKPLIRKWLAVGIILFLIVVAIVPSRKANNFKSFSENDLIVILETNKYDYQVGEPVEISIYVENHGADDITIVFPNTKMADYSVDHYLWSAGKFFLDVIIYFTISSGGRELLFHDHWGQISNDGSQVSPGIYCISGWMAESLNYPSIYAELVDINISTENHPPNPPTITGPHYGKINTNYTFSVGSITDPEGDPVYCLWDWGDGNISSWLDPSNPASHAWNAQGNYSIRVKLRDVWGAISDWSAPFYIEIVELKTAFFFGTFSTFNQTKDLFIIKSRFFIALPLPPMVFFGRTAVLSTDAFIGLGSRFIFGIGGIAVP